MSVAAKAVVQTSPIKRSAGGLRGKQTEAKRLGFAMQTKTRRGTAHGDQPSKRSACASSRRLVGAAAIPEGNQR